MSPKERELSPELVSIMKGKMPVDFNWNYDSFPNLPKPEMIPAEPTPEQIENLTIVDEGLRDGLHGVPEYPTAGRMLEYIDLASQLGIDVMTVGIYSRDGAIDKTTKKLLNVMRDQYPNISPIVLSLATQESIEWAADCAQINPNLQVIVFMGSASSRMLAEGWTKQHVLERLSWGVDKAVSEHELFVIGATEHTTQTPPDFLREIIKAQVENGAKIFCVADTIGTARPRGTYRVIKFVRKTLDKIGAKRVLIDWHGHRDTQNEIGNALTAIAAGADRVHTVPLGIGERAGNTNLEGVLWNASRILAEHGLDPRSKWDLSKLSQVLYSYAEITGNPLPTHGCLAQRAHSTSLGIHSAAILKAERLAKEAQGHGYRSLSVKLREMARTVYSAIDPRQVGREYRIEIGHYSGASTVSLWAMINKVDISPQQAENVLQVAKSLGRQLSQEEVFRILDIEDKP